MRVHVINTLLFMLFLMYSCTKDETPEVYQIQSGTYTDERDGTTYKTVKIGEQWWMAENMAYKTESGSYAYNDNEDNVSIYGYLYTLDAARIACPEGWHLPTDDEWMQLGEFIENDRDEKHIDGGSPYSFLAGKYLKSKTGWGGAGTDYYGFNGLPGGAYFRTTGYGGIEKNAIWWSGSVYSNPSDYQNLFYWVLGYGDSFLSRHNYLVIEKNDRYSVRCVKN